jgi:hypothetical protein
MFKRGLTLKKHRKQNPELEPFLLESVIEQFEQDDIMPKGIHITKDQSFSSPWRAGSYQGYFFHAENYFFREDFSDNAKVNITVNQDLIDHGIFIMKLMYKNAEVELTDEQIETCKKNYGHNVQKLKVGNILVGSRQMEDELFNGSVTIITECAKHGTVRGRFLRQEQSHITNLPMWGLPDLVGEVFFNYFDVITPGEMEIALGKRVELIPNYQNLVLDCYRER